MLVVHRVDGGQDRTSNPLITRQLIYELS